MHFRRFLGLETRPSSADSGAPVEAGPERADTETVRRIVGQLESMPPDRARWLAAYGYVLARAAAADFGISDLETRAIERLLVEHGGLAEPQAVLVAEIAKTQIRLVGGAEDYQVTREFRSVSTPEERLDLLRACFLVGASDDSITAGESAVLNEIANELDIEAPVVRALRAEFAATFSAIQTLRHEAR
jgi:uncharacterized tellurite resistance protein B-like protein